METAMSARELAQQYVAVWIEPDPEVRRKRIGELWAEGGVHVLQPPQEIREPAAELGFDDPVLEARGHEEIALRMERSYAKFVAPGEFTFRQAGEAVRLKDVVKFGWEMVPVGGGEPVGGGVEFVVLDEEGRLVADYMFPS